MNSTECMRINYALKKIIALLNDIVKMHYKKIALYKMALLKMTKMNKRKLQYV